MWYQGTTLAQIPGTAAFAMSAAMRGKNRAALEAAQVSLTEARECYAAATLKFVAMNIAKPAATIAEWVTGEARLLKEAIAAVTARRASGQPHAHEPHTAAAARLRYAERRVHFVELLRADGLTEYHLSTVAHVEERESLLLARAAAATKVAARKNAFVVAAYKGAAELLARPHKKRPKSALKRARAA